MAPMLDRRALNRALLARQHLLAPSTDHDVADMVRHLGGMQSQAPYAAYGGLRTRLARFAPEDLAGPIESGALVRIVTLRGTIHLHPAEEAWGFRRLVQPAIDRQFASSPWMKQLGGLDLHEVADAALALLTERPRTPKALGVALAERWPDRDPDALGQVGRSLLPLVQLPPRGVWGRGGTTVLAPLATWAGPPPETAPTFADLVRRYLGAFGPASVADVQTWSGLTRLATVVDGLRPDLVAFRDEEGRELFDLPDAPRPDGATPAPVILLPEFDNVLLSHADRRRIMSDAQRAALITKNGIVRGTVLVDGFPAATWRVVQRKGTATAEVDPLEELTARTRRAIEHEAAHALTFAAPEAHHEVTFTDR